MNNYSTKKLLALSLFYGSNDEWEKNDPETFYYAIQFVSDIRKGDSGYRAISLKVIIKDARKYKTRSEWRIKSPAMHGRAYRLGILEECYAHMGPDKRLSKRVTRATSDEILADAAQYTDRREWRRRSAGMYLCASRRGLIARCYDLIDKNAKSKR